jgi:hypothetical protein
VALETVAGGLLGGGLPRGARVPLGEAILGLASGGVRVGQDLLVTAERAVYRVHFGDGPRETGGGATMSATCAHALTVTPALPTPGATGAEPIGMTLERGPQGLQHVTLDLAVAREALAAGLHATTLALLFDGEARPRAQATLTLPWQAAGSETRAEGILFVIEDPAAVLGAELTLAVVVGPPEAAACARERVHLAW